MNEAKLSFYDMFDNHRVTGVAWATITPGEISGEKHLWLYNRRSEPEGGIATRLRVSALGISPAGEAICMDKFIEARSDGIKGDTGCQFDDDEQSNFTAIGGSLLEEGNYLEVGDIPPLGGRRIIFRLNIQEQFDDYGPAIILLVVGYREPE